MIYKYNTYQSVPGVTQKGGERKIILALLENHKLCLKARKFQFEITFTSPTENV